MIMDPINKKIKELIKPVIESKDLRLVRLKIFTKGKLRILQIMIEYKIAETSLIQGDGGINANICADLSYAIAPILDESNVIVGEYNLEVSSPGIDRPLITKSDFDRFIGFDIKIEFANKYQGNKFLTGKIIVSDKDLIKIKKNNEVFEVKKTNVRNAKLVLTPELIEATKNANKVKNTIKEERGLE